jgi:hypothetical protein
LAEPLVVKRDVSFRLGEPREPSGWKTGARIRVAKHLDVSAKRDGAEFPPRAGLVPPSEQLGAEADRKNFDPNSIPARDQVVPKLVDKDEHGQN